MRPKHQKTIHKHGSDIKFPRCVSTSTLDTKKEQQQLFELATMPQRSCFNSILRPNSLVRAVSNDENYEAWSTPRRQKVFISNHFEKLHDLGSDNESRGDEAEWRRPLADLSNNGFNRDGNRSSFSGITESNQLLKSSSFSFSNTTMSRTPKSSIRTSSMIEHSSNIHSSSKKKIQWDKSILDKRKDSKSHQYSSKRGYLFTRRKRYDEIIQHDVSPFINFHNSYQFYAALQASYSPISSSDDVDSSSFITTSGEASSTSTEEVLLTSKDSTEISDQIVECIQDVLDQTMTQSDDHVDLNIPNTLGHYQNFPDISRVTNETAEIAECVADINNQTMAYNSNLDQGGKEYDIEKNSAEAGIKYSLDVSHITNETAEIAECVADIKNQTMASYSNLKQGSNKCHVETNNAEDETGPLSPSTSFDLSASEILQMSSIRLQESLSSLELSTEKSDQRKDKGTDCNKKNLLGSDGCQSNFYLQHETASATITSDECTTASNLDKCSKAKSSYFNPMKTQQQNILRKNCSSSPDRLVAISDSSSYKDSVSSGKSRYNIGESPFQMNGDNDKDTLEMNLCDSAKRSLGEIPFQMKSHNDKDTLEMNPGDSAKRIFGEIPFQMKSHNDKDTLAMNPGDSAKRSLDEIPCHMKSHNNNDTLELNPGDSTKRSLGEIPFQMKSHNNKDTLEMIPGASANLVKVGISQLTSKQYEEAIVTFREALRLNPNKYGDNYSFIAKIFNNIGVAYLMQCMYSQGLESFLNALNAHNNALRKVMENRDTARIEKYDLEIADMLCNIGSVCLEWLQREQLLLSIKKKVDLSEKADHAFKRAFTIQLHYLGPDRSQVEETAKMCEEAQHLCAFFQKEMESGSIEGAKHESRYLSKSVQQHVSQNSPFTVASCPSDEYTACDFPSDETSLMNFIMESLEGEDRSKISLFSTSYPCQTGFIDSDVEIYESNSGTVSLSPASKNILQLSQRDVNDTPSQDVEEDDNQIQHHSLPYSLYNSIFEQKPGTDGSESDIETKNTENSKRSRQLDESNDDVAPLQGESNEMEGLNEDVLLSNPEKYANEIYNLGTKYLQEGKLDESLRLLTIALQGYKSKYGELHYTIGAALHNIGIVYLRSQKYDEALESFQKASRNRKGSIGRNHADVAVSLVKVGITQLLLKRFDDALISLREALSIRRNSLGYLHPSTARIYNNIGCVHVEFNEMREARRAFEAALDVQRSAMCYEPHSGPLQFGTATTLCNLGYLYCKRGMHEKACLVLEEAFDLQQRVVGESHPTVLSTLDALADSYGKSGDNTNAMNCFNQIINRLLLKSDQVSNQCSPKTSRALGVVYYKISKFHRKQNDLQAALQALEKSLSFINRISSPTLLGRIQKEMDEVEVALANTDMNWL